MIHSSFAVNNIIDKIVTNTYGSCDKNAYVTNISDFYKWDEIKLEDKDIFCWRTFYTFGEKDNYCNWLPVPTNQYIGKYNYKDLIDMIYQSHINDIPVTYK